MKKSNTYHLKNRSVLNLEKKRLKLQAEKLFEFESLAIKKQVPKKIERILDIGCGNGHYLKLLSKFFKAEGLGIDRNKNLLNEATEKNKKGMLVFKQVDIDDRDGLIQIINNYNPDLIIARYVVQHFSKKQVQDFFKTLLLARNSKRRICIIDTDYKNIRHSARDQVILKLINEKIKYQKRRGGDCTIGSSLKKLSEKYKFTSIKEKKVLIGVNDLGQKKWLEIFGKILTSACYENFKFKTKKHEMMIHDFNLWAKEGAGDKKRNVRWPVYITSFK